MTVSLLVAILASVPVFAQQCPSDRATELATIDRALDGNDLSDADRLLTKLSTSAGSCAAVLALHSRLELMRRNYDAADELSDQALRAGPEDTRALTIRGAILSLQRRSQEGQAMLERAIMRDPANAAAYYELGLIYDRQKLSAEAVNVFQKVVKLRPDDARGWDYLALNLEPLGRITEAEQAYKTGLAVNRPLFDWFLDYNYGRLLLKLNRLEDSKAHLDRAVELVPRLRAPHYDDAKLNVRLGNFKAAQQDAMRALDIPDRSGTILDLQIYSLLAMIYAAASGILSRRISTRGLASLLQYRCGRRSEDNGANNGQGHIHDPKDFQSDVRRCGGRGRRKLVARCFKLTL